MDIKSRSSSTNTIELADHMEKHVVKAFQIASALAGAGRAVSAADLLRAAIIVQRRGEGSPAFQKLESLLPLDNLPRVSKVKLISAVRLSPELAESYRIAQKLFPGERIWGRDYVTIALHADSEQSLHEVAHEASTTVAQLQDAWFVFVTSDEQHRKRGDWERWWKEAGVPVQHKPVSPAKEPVVTEAFRFAQTLSDLDHRNDWIGIRADVEALSTLVAVNRVEPPLSIAIFGDWGSGKTFLMRKVQERVQLLETIGETQADELHVGSSETRYCGSILQIEFNAWHYTESNLWASLVNHIFEKLHTKLTPEDKDEQRTAAVEKFFEAFGLAHAAREEAQKQVDLIAAEVSRADRALNEEKTNVETASRDLVKAMGRSVWKYLDQELEKESTETSNLRTALTHFGFKDSFTSAQTIYETVGRFRSVSGRAREVFGSLLATRAGVTGAIIVALAVLAATAFAVIYEVPVLTISTAVAGTLVWLAERATSARKLLDWIQAFDEWFSKLKQEEENSIAASIAKAQASFEKHKGALSLARRQLAEAEAREALAKEELKQLTARDQMRRFIDQRVTAQAYAKHLGIISMIRRDFEDLSDFMYRDRQLGEARLVARVEDEVEEAIPTVERIILYIDDLDRCQPKRVVEVLEAIHLLLAFRLFVVVVAVDPRWVIESLRRCYPHLSQKERSGSEGTPPSLQGDVNAQGNLEATAHDYLEKIFHIPFWVKPIGPEACKSLIAGYLGFTEPAPERHDEEEQQDDRFDAIVKERSAGESAVTLRPPIEPVEPFGDETQEKVSKHEQTLERQARERDAARRQIENVEITAREEAFIGMLAPYLGNSPRRIKRYANTYRLLKSGLTRQEARLFAAGDGSKGGYRIVLVFLAIVTGAPSLAPRIFAEAFALRGDFKVETLIKESGLKDESADPIEATNAKGALKLLNRLGVTPRDIETWVPRVMRYAFRLTPVNLVATADSRPTPEVE